MHSKYTLLETNKEIARLGNPAWYIGNKSMRCNITYNEQSMLIYTPLALDDSFDLAGITSIYDLTTSIETILWSIGYFHYE